MNISNILWVLVEFIVLGAGLAFYIRRDIRKSNTKYAIEEAALKESFDRENLHKPFATLTLALMDDIYYYIGSTYGCPAFCDVFEKIRTRLIEAHEHGDRF